MFRRVQDAIRVWQQADIAQLVERNLAKVEVAGSSPVVRSDLLVRSARFAGRGGVAERRGNGLQSRLHGFKSRLHLQQPTRPSGRVGFVVSGPGRRTPDLHPGAAARVHVGGWRPSCASAVQPCVHAAFRGRQGPDHPPVGSRFVTRGVRRIQFSPLRRRLRPERSRRT